jgi:hypothetical protein
MTRSHLFIVVGIALAALVRWNYSSPLSRDDSDVSSETIRAEVQDFLGCISGAPTSKEIEDLNLRQRRWGVERHVFQSYDAEARVVVGVGPDGKPGAAGIDDGNNGIVDDADELGATRSDDLFEVIPGQHWSDVDRPPVEMILSQGGWIDRTHDDGLQAGGKPMPVDRCIVVGKGFEIMVTK